MSGENENVRSSGPLRNHPCARFTYLEEPDYTRPLYELPDRIRTRIVEKLAFLYGEDQVEKIVAELERIMKVFHAHKPPDLVEWEKDFDPIERFSERDMMLITYGDLVRAENEKPLKTLARIADHFAKDVITCIHILPFFPYSSDRGFSILDFESVDPSLGTWDEIAYLAQDFRLMFDGVVNHVSSKSRWFQEFLNANPLFEDYFIKFEKGAKIDEHVLALVLRPRTSDLFTTFHSLDGPIRVWTTFSPDQVDLNYKSPEVLLKMLEILLFYIRHGADIIRLDAVTYLWEELGTQCANLPQTHRIVQLFRDVLDAVAPHVTLVTETNVPHKENIKYFGDGTNEAQMVYNFPLPPLALHTIHTGDATILSDWASTLKKPSETATYLNFLDSHDGIGLLGARGILPQEAIDAMCKKIVEHGGLISYRTDSEGKKSPYELNSTWYSAMNNANSNEERALQVNRFVASRSIALALRGVPAVYLHGAIGSLNDREAVLVTHVNRSINRHYIDADELLREAGDPTSRWSMIRTVQRPLVQARISCKAFHPNGDQEVLKLGSALFALLRTSVDQSERVLCMTNVTAVEQALRLPSGLVGQSGTLWGDLATGQARAAEDGGLHVTLAPYQVTWLRNTER